MRESVKYIIGLLVAGFFLVACGAAPTEQAAEPTTTSLPPTATPEPEPALPTDTPPPDTSTATAMPEPLPDTTTPVPPTATPVSVAGPEGNPDLEYAQVVYVKVTQSGDGSWRFDTTVRHNDQGWDNYADAWQVVNPETDEILGERILLHPHDNEQPFTRSQTGIVIPPEVSQVIVRAKDNVEGFGGQVVLVDLTVQQGENFEVIRQ